MPAQRELALDTGPAIYLDHLRYVHLLTDQFRVLLAPAVAWELRQLPGAPGSSVPDLPGVEIVRPPLSQVEGAGVTPRFIRVNVKPSHWRQTATSERWSTRG